MEWQRLVHFAEVARREHLTRAAEALHITEPALSRSIARLEAELGVPLFDRVGRSIRLNRFGRTFQPRAERALSEVRLGRQDLGALSGTEGGTVALGFGMQLGESVVPDLVGALGRAHPSLRLELHEAEGGRVRALLDAGTAELGMWAQPVPGPDAGWIELFRQTLVLTMAEKHRFAGRGSVSVGELQNERFVTLKAPSDHRRAVEELCRTAGFEPNVAFETDSVHTMVGIVAAGLGVAISLESRRSDGRSRRDGVVEVGLKGRGHLFYTGVGWVADRFLSAAAVQLRDFVVDRFRVPEQA